MPDDDEATQEKPGCMGCIMAKVKGGCFAFKDAVMALYLAYSRFTGGGGFKRPGLHKLLLAYGAPTFIYAASLESS